MKVKDRQFNGHTAVKPIKIAVCSGHGIGKSACIGMITNWIMSCWPDSHGTATANTYQQLSSKTWASITHWGKQSITSHWFEFTSEKIYRVGEKENWFLNAQTCSEENSEAFAGQHAANSVSYYLNDECSAIPEAIWPVEAGGLTDGMPMQFLFGNPTQPLGYFARVMKHQEPGDWVLLRIDSRECPIANKDLINEWIDAYGEDSDFVRVRVRGLAPRAAPAQFIAEDLIAEAQKRIVIPLSDDPLVIGVDFAWGGDDSNCVRFRRGLDARSIPPVRIPGEQTRRPEAMVTVLADILSKTYSGHKVEAAFLDSAGIAGPVATRLRELGFRNVIECNFMAGSVDPAYKNVRSMIWGRLKAALPQMSIDKSVTLAEDLAAPEVIKHLPLTLEPKESIIKRIGHSTDDGDALALTFYQPVRSEQARKEHIRKRKRPSSVVTAWS